jgi:uncharacterized protein with PQ loop repeat
LYYLSPLSTLAQVLRTRDASSLTLPMCAMNVVNGTLWVIYGIVRRDAFLCVPNGAGAVLGIVQVALCCVFPRRALPCATSIPMCALSINRRQVSSTLLSCVACVASRACGIVTRSGNVSFEHMLSPPVCFGIDAQQSTSRKLRLCSGQSLLCVLCLHSSYGFPIARKC